MIVYHKNNEIDREQYDTCIRNSGYKKPYAWSWYLDIMAPGWEALADDDYDSVFPLPSAAKYGFHYIATPVFLQQLGVFSPDKPAEEVAGEFLQYLPDFYKLIDLNLNLRPPSEEFTISELHNFELDLRKSWEELSQNFSEHCRRNIITAGKRSPDFVDDSGPDELIDLFIRNKGQEIKGIKPSDYQRLRNLMNFCLINKKGKITGVRDKKGKLCYGMFTVETRESITMLFVVNTSQSREMRTGYLAVSDIIRSNAGSGRILDFAGSSIPGVAAFMESFGATPKPYYRVYRNRLLWPLRLLK